MQKTSKPISLKSDPAYLYTSLDANVAKWWKNYDGKSDGIILEIQLSKGTKAAYIDSRIIDFRGYYELVLERNLELTATSAREEGEFKILSVKTMQ